MKKMSLPHRCEKTPKPAPPHGSCTHIFKRYEYGPVVGIAKNSLTIYINGLGIKSVKETKGEKKFRPFFQVETNMIFMHRETSMSSSSVVYESDTASEERYAITP